MSKFKLTQTAAEVQNILNNSLQKPTGLTKTKLVGVGVNGQENIEIGDNLTLANGKLSAAAGGVNGLESDAEGNLTASKNLGVDGKLTLKSLVSESNPDGDITKALGSERHVYRVIGNNTFHYTVFTTKNYNLQLGKPTTIEDFKTNDNYKELRAIGTHPAAGYFKDDFNDNLILNTFTVRQDSYYGYDGYDVKTSETSSVYLSRDSVRFFYVVQLY